MGPSEVSECFLTCHLEGKAHWEVALSIQGAGSSGTSPRESCVLQAAGSQASFDHISKMVALTGLTEQSTESASVCGSCPGSKHRSQYEDKAGCVSTCDDRGADCCVWGKLGGASAFSDQARCHSHWQVWQSSSPPRPPLRARPGRSKGPSQGCHGKTRPRQAARWRQCCATGTGAREQAESSLLDEVMCWQGGGQPPCPHPQTMQATRREMQGRQTRWGRLRLGRKRSPGPKPAPFPLSASAVQADKGMLGPSSQARSPVSQMCS